MTPLNKITRNELALAAIVAALVAISPLSSTHWQISIPTGLAVGLLVLGYRVFMGVPQSASPSGNASSSPSDTMASSGRMPVTTVLCLVIFMATFAPTLHWLGINYTNSVWVNVHGVFIPPIIAYLSWEILRRDPQKQPESSAWGFAFLIPGLLLLVMDSAMQTHYVAAAAFVVCLPGLALLFLGKRRTLMLWFPLVLGLSMIPIPLNFDASIALRRVTAWGAELILSAQGTNVIRYDTLLELPWGGVLVTKGCSGLSTIYSSVTIAAVIIYYSQTFKRRLLVALACVPFALLANMVRVYFLIRASEEVGVQIMDTPVHGGSGAVVFGFVLVALYAISDMPGRTRKRPT